MLAVALVAPRVFWPKTFLVLKYKVLQCPPPLFDLDLVHSADAYAYTGIHTGQISSLILKQVLT